MFDKLGGIAVIVVTIALFCLMKLLDPPMFVQIPLGLAGIFFYLVGVVFLFAEGSLLVGRLSVRRPRAAVPVSKGARA